MLALLAQLAPKPRDPDGNAARAVRVLHDRADVDLAVFPELYLGGFTLRHLDELALEPGAGPLATIAAAAAATRTAVVVGFAERLADGFANAAACFDADGSLAGVYRKTHLFGAEAEAFTAGDEQLVVPLAGTLVAPLICFDIEFPEPARAVARAGAELLVTASANMAPYGPDHALASRARALDNRLAHLYANRIGSEGRHRFEGGSCAVAADGSVLIEASPDDEELLVVEIDRPQAPEADVDYLRHARGELPVATPAPAPAHGRGDVRS
jgi:predicted amidohydrolase